MCVSFFSTIFVSKYFTMVKHLASNAGVAVEMLAEARDGLHVVSVIAGRL